MRPPEDQSQGVRHDRTENTGKRSQLPVTPWFASRRRWRSVRSLEELLRLAADILDTQPGQTLVLADAEHFTVELLDKVKTQTKFDLLVPMPDQPSLRAKLRKLPSETFRPRWAGYATAKLAYTPKNSQ